MSDEQEIREAVDAAKAPGTFNIVEVLSNRGYPKSEIDVYLDESAIYEMSGIDEKLEALDNQVNGKSETAKQKKQREDIFIERDNIIEKIEKSHYVVHLTGISEGKREELYRKAAKKYPVEYEKANDITSLIGGNSAAREKESPERDALFTDFLWQEHIERIVSPEGEEQTEFPYSTVRSMRESFPLNAMIRINEGIEKLRAKTAMFTMETGEDFLAKP